MNDQRVICEVCGDVLPSYAVCATCGYQDREWDRDELAKAKAQHVENESERDRA